MVSFPTSSSVSPKSSSGRGPEDKSVSVDAVSEENLRERRYLWTARAFAMVFVASLITNILMLMALFSLVPLTRVQPYELIFANKEAQTVTVQPLPVTPSVLEGISESLVRQYVTLRKTITADPDEMAYRWGADGPVNLFSTGNTFRVFADQAGKILDVAVKSQITRDVEINSVIKYVSQDRGEYWIVDYNLITMSPQDATKKIVPYVATVYITYEPFNGTWGNRLKNPIGFKVMQFGDETKESYDAREKELLKNNRQR